MWAQIGCSAAVLFAFQVFAATTHLQKLQTKFPYGLLSDDFGILNENDLAVNTCTATPVPFSDQSTSYSYWQCFEARTSRLFCEGKGFSESEETHLTMMVVSGEQGSTVHEYLAPRAIPLTDCRIFEREWKNLVRGNKYVCVSGELIRQDQSHKKFYWVFDRFKTKKGCNSYFVGGCSLKYQIAQGCKLH